MEKSKVLVVSGTGYLGRRIVSASLSQGHPTYVLQRQGAHLVEGSFSDLESLVRAVKLVDVVICPMSLGYIFGVTTYCWSSSLLKLSKEPEILRYKHY
ncbi:isoflavone reductase homolog [Prunus yedoensis var. nudiflora]|uniref:Isoflavone reductase homolog n=1 Tax=Prunus yedoensis var. nudiflora TaxID=2094558 RepID=A0A314UKU9_PRUYE|nr:isoflavone reductase homolog [Prunus yedoensis var. nudiflora]